MAGPDLRSRTLHHITQIMHFVAGDTLRLLEVVAAGPYEWRVSLLKASRGLAVDETVADTLFAFFYRLQQRRYGASANVLLDAIEVKSPPTQAEIDNAWEVESGSSEEGRRALYGVDGHPEELITRRQDW